MASRSKKNRNIKKIEKMVITAPVGTMKNVQEQFGYTGSLETVNTLDDLRLDLPNIIIAKCKRDAYFNQNDFGKQKITHGKNYVMSISTYKILEYEKPILTKETRRILEPAKVSFRSLYKPYRGQELHNKKLLVMRTGGIGDLIFILPNLIYLKDKYPSCKIVLATSLQYHSMVEMWIKSGYIDKVISLPFLDIEFKSSQYHLSFEGVIERTHIATKVNAYNLFSQWMGLDLPNELLHPKQEWNSHALLSVYDILKEHIGYNNDSKLCVIQIKASSPIRTPHPEHFWLPIFRYVVSRGYKIIITDNPLLHDAIDTIINKYLHYFKDSIFNFSKYSKTISHSIALASLVDIVIGTDSSMIHIAESVGTRNLGIYGPFPGSVRVSNYQYGEWIDCDKMECAPCFTHGHRPCLYGGNNGGCSPCYNDIDMKEFKEKFVSLTTKENVK